MQKRHQPAVFGQSSLAQAVLLTFTSDTVDAAANNAVSLRTAITR